MQFRVCKNKKTRSESINTDQIRIAVENAQNEVERPEIRLWPKKNGKKC